MPNDEGYCGGGKGGHQALGGGLWVTGRMGDPRHNVRAREENLILLCPEHAQAFAKDGWAVVETPDCFQIAVVGSAGATSFYFEGARSAFILPIDEQKID